MIKYRSLIERELNSRIMDLSSDDEDPYSSKIFDHLKHQIPHIVINMFRCFHGINNETKATRLVRGHIVIHIQNTVAGIYGKIHKCLRNRHVPLSRSQINVIILAQALTKHHLFLFQIWIKINQFKH
ncbi:hypothetical protein BpHYR1_048788 [Brachionus plicatilis]|uniref:Uncharacterized protein n=1 Tax=Brachionus plicatilis TaxID=10195 RepID=A0A3M7RTU8_BRAPC|nr:hypothetical protein BpHYR1_048788 [Brachionus plicatilis]